MTLLLDNPNGGNPTADSANTWKNNFGLTSIYVAADPNFSMVPGSSVGTPQITIVDPRNMQVVLIQEGWGGSYPPELEQLAQDNKLP
jgi:hypothetical protein